MAPKKRFLSDILKKPQVPQLDEFPDEAASSAVSPWAKQFTKDLKAIEQLPDYEPEKFDPIVSGLKVEFTPLNLLTDSSEESPKAKNPKSKSISEIYNQPPIPPIQSQAQVPEVNASAGQSEEQLDQLVNVLVPPPLPSSMSDVLNPPVTQSQILAQVTDVHVSSNARQAEEAHAQFTDLLGRSLEADYLTDDDDPNPEEEVAQNSFKVGDTVKLLSQEPEFEYYIARIYKVQGQKLHCFWYYHPQEAIGGRKSFHGKAELFSSNHKTIQPVATVLGKCTVHSFEEYKKLAVVDTDNDFFSRFHYDHTNLAFTPDQAFTPNTITVHCLCEMPDNPDVLMTQCDHCTEWYHSHCINMTDEEMKMMRKYICKNCALAIKAKKEAKQQANKRTVTNRMYFEIDIDGEAAGKIVIGLYGKGVPKTARIFKALCRGDKPVGGLGDKAVGGKKGLHYKGTNFHRIYPGKCVQGGRIVRASGDGYEYEQIRMEEEKCFIKPETGMIYYTSVAPPYTAGLEFTILLAEPDKEIDGCIVIGEVLSGLDMLLKIGTYGQTDSGLPTKRVTVSNSGEVEDESSGELEDKEM